MEILLILGDCIDASVIGCIKTPAPCLVHTRQVEMGSYQIVSVTYIFGARVTPDKGISGGKFIALF